MARQRKKVTLPEMPPPTDDELALKRQAAADHCADLDALTNGQHQRNLDKAVLLAQQAARRHGPLIDHFAELGRRYGDTLPPKPKPKE